MLTPLVALAAALLAACAAPIETQSSLGLGGELAPRRIAVAPFEVAPTARAEAPDDVNERFSAYLGDAIGQRGQEVVPFSDLVLAAAAASKVPDRETRRGWAQLASEQFGADVLAVGRLDRFRERSGEAMGSERPASVAFDIELLSAPSGDPLWRGRFDQTQRSLTESVLQASRYPGRGTRWLTVNEFAQWGMQKVVRVMPFAP